MIELDATGNIPRQDERCQAYHVAGVEKGRAWSGFNMWGGNDYWRPIIEAYDTFRGWATPLVDGSQRSSQPSEDFVKETPARLRFALFRHPDNRQYLQLWSSDNHDSQAKFAGYQSFVAWVTDTLEPLPMMEVPQPPNLSVEVELLAAQTTPLSTRQQQLLKDAAAKLRQHGF